MHKIKRLTSIIKLLIISRMQYKLSIWSIKVFKSSSFISKSPDAESLKGPSLQASDVTDVPASFIADPFILFQDSKYYMFFEVLDKSLGRGFIGLASSENGDRWTYERIVIKENFHLSYPYLIKHNNSIYMIPESIGANRVLLYKAKNFPYEWGIVRELLCGKYDDPSIFQYNNKWWMFAGQNGRLHLFASDHLEGQWIEHPKSPLISENLNISRPGGRVIVEENEIYRYTQDGEPYYGSAVRAFKVKELSEVEYKEEEVSLVLSGSKKLDWRKDGMHHIDQLKVADNQWLIAVDGHKFERRNYLVWLLKSKVHRMFERFQMRRNIDDRSL
jgi:hypothetical protein